MKCLVISPKNGTVRISRFSSDSRAGRVRAAKVPSAVLCDNLQRRNTEPLELSPELQARLASLSRQRALHVQRQN